MSVSTRRPVARCAPRRPQFSVTPHSPADGSIGEVRALECPIELPLRHYASAAGLERSEVSRGVELHGANSFAIPMPTLWELYKEQLASPVAIFQVPRACVRACVNLRVCACVCGFASMRSSSLRRCQVCVCACVRGL